MKKYISFLFIFCVFIQWGFSQKTQKVNSTVNSAVVFLNKAQVKRTVNVSLQKGTTVLNFLELSPFIDAKSLQVKANPSVSILAVNHKKNYLNKTKKSEKVKVLEAKIEGIEEQLILASTENEIVYQNIDFLQKNKSIGGKNQTLTVTNLKQTANYYATQFKKLKLEALGLSKKIKKLKNQKLELQQEIKTVSNKKDYPTGEVHVKIEVLKAHTASFEITYLVDNVSWYPSYDIKATNVNEPIQLVYKANLQQNSQVDWNNIEVSFSSDNPKTSGVSPELLPYKLSFNQSRSSTPKKNIKYIEGTIISGSDGLPLPGVTVNCVGSNIGTSTDFDGHFSLSIPNNVSSIKVSYVGFENQIKNIDREKINFTLKEDVNTLDEVVVVGYGSQKKKNLSHSVNSINANQINNSSKLSIRGLSSISNHSSPMVIVDGVVVENSFLEQVDMNQVENMEVLKDAASTSIYGSSASNGVVLITTKNGANTTTQLTQTAVSFNLNKKRTITSDVKSKEIKLKTLYIPANYQYYTVPKLDKSAYLVAKIKDWEKYQLLDGETNIFFDNTFKSKGLLDLSSVKKEIVISLGVDKQISVDRTQVTENNNKKFLSKNIETNKHWKIEVKNNKNQDINIQVLDQVPVAIIDAIKVEVINTSNAKKNEKSGELKWNLTIPKKTVKSLDVEYTVKHPKNRKLIIE